MTGIYRLFHFSAHISRIDLRQPDDGGSAGLPWEETRLQQSYDKFVGYYNFTPRFCNPGAGHEKGGVEGLVGYARRNYMVPVPHAESLEALNQRLLEECMAYGEHRMATRDQSVNELYEAERNHLIDLPEIAFSNIELCSPKVDKYATAIVDKNHYSVPTRYTHCEGKGDHACRPD